MTPAPPPATAPLLDVKNLSFAFKAPGLTFGPPTLLWHVPHFQILGPGLYLLVGANGSGKSTFLRTLAGLLKTQPGGHVGWDPALTVGYLAEWPVMTSPHLKVTDLIRAVTGERLHLDEFKHSFFSPITNDLNKKFATLSKGQQQRAMLYLVHHRNPHVVLCDEPFSGLDPWAKQELCTFFLGLIAQNKTLFISTHEVPRTLGAQVTGTALCAHKTIDWSSAHDLSFF